MFPFAEYVARAVIGKTDWDASHVSPGCICLLWVFGCYILTWVTSSKHSAITAPHTEEIKFECIFILDSVNGRNHCQKSVPEHELLLIVLSIRWHAV